MKSEAEDQPNRAITVEVVAPVLETPGLCAGCELVLGEAGVGGPSVQEPADYPAEWRAEYERLVSLLSDLSKRYGPDVRFVWLDPATPAGLWAGIRHGIRRYPTFIVAGRYKVVGADAALLMSQIDAARSEND